MCSILVWRSCRVVHVHRFFTVVDCIALFITSFMIILHIDTDNFYLKNLTLSKLSFFEKVQGFIY